MIKLKSLLEDKIGKVSRKINVTLELDNTPHGDFRRFRHNEQITDKEILAVAQRAVELIGRGLLNNELNIGDYIIVRDSRTKLNIVGGLTAKGDVLEFVVVTVMRKDNFKPKAGTKIIDV